MKHCLTLAVSLAATGCDLPNEANVGPRDLLDVRRSTSDPTSTARDALVTETLVQANALWTRQFARFGDGFAPARAVVFSDDTTSDCRVVKSDEGPTFCRADSRIYLSDSYWARYASDIGESEPVSQAVAVAHEVGHVVQRQTGDYDRAIAAMETASANARGPIKAALELQADCYAGLWFRESAHASDTNAVARAERSREAVGDDFRQKRVRGWHDPAEISHGMSAQRVAAFRRGLASGNPDDCEFRQDK